MKRICRLYKNLTNFSDKKCHCEYNEAISLFLKRLPRTFQVLAMTVILWAYIFYRWIWNLIAFKGLKDTATVKIFFNALFIILLCIAFPCIYHQATGADEAALLTGKVLNIKAVPVEGAEIFIYNSPDVRRPADFISARTAKDGSFRIDLPAGIYWAVARLRRGEQFGPLMPGDKHSGEPIEIELAPGEEIEQDFTVVDLRETARLKRKTSEDYIKIKGRVLDKNNTPVEKVYVIANKNKECSGIPDYLSAWTDKSGYYTLYLTRGKYFIGYATSFPSSQDCRVYSEIVFDTDENDFVIIINE